MTIVPARRERAFDNFKPALAGRQLAEQFAGGGIGLRHPALSIEHQHCGRQGAEQRVQTGGKALAFQQRLTQLRTGLGKLAAQAVRAFRRRRRPGGALQPRFAPGTLGAD